MEGSGYLRGSIALFPTRKLPHHLIRGWLFGEEGLKPVEEQSLSCRETKHFSTSSTAFVPDTVLSEISLRIIFKNFPCLCYEGLQEGHAYVSTIS